MSAVEILPCGRQRPVLQAIPWPLMTTLDGNTRSLHISSHGIDLVGPEYSGLSTRIINMVIHQRLIPHSQKLVQYWMRSPLQVLYLGIYMLISSLVPGRFEWKFSMFRHNFQANFKWLMAEVSLVKLPSDGCQWTLLVTSQEWFR